MFFPVNLFIRPLDFNKLAAKSKDIYRHEITCTGNMAQINFKCAFLPAFHLNMAHKVLHDAL